MASEMSDLVPTLHDYVNIVRKKNGEETVNYKESPELIGSSLEHHPYVNVSVRQKDGVSSSRKHRPVSGVDNLNFPKKSSHNSLDASSLRRYLSETELLSTRKGLSADSRDQVMMPGFLDNVSNLSPISTEQAIANAKLRLLNPQGVAKGSDCSRCDDLVNLLATSHIESGSLTRNYSRILGLLIQIRGAAMALECRLDQRAGSPFPSSTTSNAAAASLSQGSTTMREVRDTGILTTTAAVAVRHMPASSRPLKSRQSMFVNHTGLALTTAGIRGERDIAENMYPIRKGSTTSLSNPAPVMINSAALTKDLTDLKSHLGNAIDLCQQLAASCFKNTHLSTLHKNHVSNSTHTSGHAKKNNTEMADPGFNYTPFLPVTTEMRQRRAPSAPSLECSTELGTSHSRKTPTDTEIMATADAKASSSGLEEDLTMPKFTNSSEERTNTEVDVSLSSDEDVKVSSGRTSELGSVCVYSESDVKYVMSKIASLEEERYRLLETIDQLHIENSTVSFVRS